MPEQEPIADWLRTIPDWGTVPAGLAFFAAAVAAYFGGRTLSIVQATRNEDVDQKRQWQASTVAIWLTTKEGNSNSIAVMGANGSGVPVFDLTIWSKIDDRISPVIDLPAFGPSREPRDIEQATNVYRRVNPDYQMHFLAVLMELGGLGVAVQFRDASNIWWYRDFDGTLTEGMHPPGRPGVKRKKPEVRWRWNLMARTKPANPG